MKIRDGLVSNSSSSSFIVSSKKDKLKVYSEINVDPSETFTTIEELNKWFKEDYFDITDAEILEKNKECYDFAIEIYDKAKKAIENGEKVFEIRVENTEEILDQALREKQPDITLLYSE